MHSFLLQIYEMFLKTCLALLWGEKWQGRHRTSGVGDSLFRFSPSWSKKWHERIALVALFKRATRAKWADLSFTFTQERFALVWKSDSLFVRVGFAPFYIFSVNHISCACRGEKKCCTLLNSYEERFALVKKRREQFALVALLKRAKDIFGFFVKKRAIRKKNQLANS